ncbi:MAG: hypothetical protein ACP5E3_04835 [Bacteroidales bacterium]
MKKESNKRSIYVYTHWQEIDEPFLMGVLYSEILKGSEVFSFEYFRY